MADCRLKLPYLTATVRHRTALTSGKMTLADVARQEKLQPKYLGVLWQTLTDKTPSEPLDRIRARWRQAEEKDVGSLAQEITAWQTALWKFVPVGSYRDGNTLRQVANDPAAVAVQPLRVAVKPDGGQSEVVLYLVTRTISADGQTGHVVWQRPRFEGAGKTPLLLRDYAQFGTAYEVRLPDGVRRLLPNTWLRQRGGPRPVALDRGPGPQARAECSAPAALGRGIGPGSAGRQECREGRPRSAVAAPGIVGGEGPEERQQADDQRLAPQGDRPAGGGDQRLGQGRDDPGPGRGARGRGPPHAAGIRGRHLDESAGRQRPRCQPRHPRPPGLRQRRGLVARAAPRRQGVRARRGRPRNSVPRRSFRAGPSRSPEATCSSWPSTPATAITVAISRRSLLPSPRRPSPNASGTWRATWPTPSSTATPTATRTAMPASGASSGVHRGP